MKASEVREKYLKFFEKHGHKRISPAPLVLENDATTLFTSSGMQPLVPYLLGQTHAEGSRLVDVQPCIRVQDIEEVGDSRHDTYFEMLGNWSLGDYFKKEQLPWIWEFFTKELNLPEARLYVTIFEGNKDVPRDTESYDIWKSLGVSDAHIAEYGVKKNWWSRAGTPDEMPIGEPGGPTSEIFYEFEDVKHDKKFGEACHPNCDCGRFVELGNSVFMVYEKTENGLVELAKKNVDFGGGFERIAMAVENQPDLFMTSIFHSTIKKIEEVTGKKYEDSEETTRYMRIVAEHLRASEALIKTGVVPGNKQQGYILRRLIRRSAVSVRNLKDELDVGDLSLSSNETVNRMVEDELGKFIQTLDKGLKILNKLESVDGKVAFDLYQSYGFPLEITEEILEERGRKVDRSQFEKEFTKHQEKSRTASAGKFKGGLADHSAEVTRLHTATHLLHAALRQVLGDHVSQKGSNITAERLRFDFTHDKKLTEGEIKKVEDLVNDQVNKGVQVSFKIMTLGEARGEGALAFFGERYGEKVKVYSIGVFSKEVCGGPHVVNTKEIGHVKITKTERVGAGVMRIYATCSGNPK